MKMSDINFADSVYAEENVFEFENNLYEDLRSYLHLDHCADLVKDNIKFRVIFCENDYDYIQDNQELTDKLIAHRSK